MDGDDIGVVHVGSSVQVGICVYLIEENKINYSTTICVANVTHRDPRQVHCAGSNIRHSVTWLTAAPFYGVGW